MHRRDFLRTTAFALPVLMTDYSFAGTYPTFEQFKNDRTLGQRYIEGLVARDLGPEAYNVVTEFLFDMDGSKCKDTINKHFSVRISDAYMEGLVNRMTSDAESMISAANMFLTADIAGMSDEDILNLFRKPSTRQRLLDGIKRNVIYNECLSNNGITVPNDKFSGKSSIIISNDVANDSEYELRWSIFGRQVPYASSELKVRGTLRHEFAHALDIYYGIDINGKRVKLYDTNISMAAVSAILEARARKVHVNFLKEYNKKRGKPSEKYTHEYVARCTEMAGFMVRLLDAKDDAKTDEEKALLDIVIKDFEPSAIESVKVVEEVTAELGDP